MRRFVCFYFGIGFSFSFGFGVVFVLFLFYFGFCFVLGFKHAVIKPETIWEKSCSLSGIRNISHYTWWTARQFLACITSYYTKEKCGSNEGC